MSRKETKGVVPTKLIDLFREVIPNPHTSLSYAHLSEPAIVQRSNSTDEALPIYPSRPAQRISAPLKATWTETEAGRPSTFSFNTPVRVPVRNASDDPIFQIAAQTIKVELFLSSRPVAEVSEECTYADMSFDAPPSAQKRIFGDMSIMPESAKKRRKADSSFIEEFGSDMMDGTVLPENILRMVDVSLVETPERVIVNPRVQAAAPGPSPRVPGARYAYDDKGEDDLKPKLTKNTWINPWKTTTSMPAPTWGNFF